MREKQKQIINKRLEETTQEYLANGLIPPVNLNVNFSPSAKQYELWKCLEPNSCNKCGGAIERTPTDDITVVTGFIPSCSKCGNKDIPQVILGGGAAGGGKAFPPDSKVMTPTGWVKVKDLQVGDMICSPDKKDPSVVTRIHPSDNFEFYRIEFEDGSSVEASEAHEWAAWQTRKRNQKVLLPDKNGIVRCHNVMETKEIYDWFVKKEGGMYKGCNLRIPLTDPIEMDTYADPALRPINPYLMGVLLGNGALTNKRLLGGVISFSDGDNEVVERITEICETQGVTVSSKWIAENNVWKVDIKDKAMAEFLEEIGLAGKYSHEKFIPEVYKNAPLADRFSLVQGMMDTDGSVDHRGHMEYSSASKVLSEGVQYVVRSLGGYATLTVKEEPVYTSASGEKKIGMPSYRVYIRSPYASKMVYLPRKKERCNDSFNGGTSPFGKTIVSIEPIGKKEGMCISTSNPSGLYVVEDFTVTHNSYVGCYWILFACFKFSKIKAVIARKTLKSLEGSTWATLRFIINDELGLIEKVHYKEDKVKGVIMFWNGSSITKQELELLPSDPTYQRLGSNEYTIAFVDEAGEIVEKGVEVLYSRLRWRVAETFRVPKIFLSTNPVPNWVRDRFVQDAEGNPVKTRRGDTFVQFSVFDNPREDFVQIYASSLSNMRDEKEKLRLLYGNWDFLASSDNVIYNQFNGEKHIITNLKKKKYNPLLPLIFIYDFNVIPQMSVLVAQVNYDEKNVYIIDEISGTPKEKTNSTPAVSRVVAKYIKTLGHTGGVVISGDSTGTQRNSATEVDVNNYSIIRSELLKEGVKSTQNVMSKNPPHKTRTEFINMILQGNTEWSVYIDLACRKLTSDLMYQEKNPDGTKCKKKVIDPETGSKYEKYGHFSDNLDYLMCTFLANDWNRYVNGDLGEAYSPNAIVSASPKSMFKF